MGYYKKSPSFGLPVQLRYVFPFFSINFKKLFTFFFNCDIFNRAWGYSSVGRALASHVRGQGFDSPYLGVRLPLSPPYANKVEPDFVCFFFYPLFTGMKKGNRKYRVALFLTVRILYLSDFILYRIIFILYSFSSSPYVGAVYFQFVGYFNKAHTCYIAIQSLFFSFCQLHIAYYFSAFLKRFFKIFLEKLLLIAICFYIDFSRISVKKPSLVNFVANDSAAQSELPAQGRILP